MYVAHAHKIHYGPKTTAKDNKNPIFNVFLPFLMIFL